MVWVAGVEFMVDGTVEWSKVGILIILDPWCSRSRIILGHALLEAKGSIKMCHVIVAHVSIVHAIEGVCGLFVVVL